MECQEWDPSQFFRPSHQASPYALLVLNQPINETAFGVLSDHASYIICADGGANRLYDMLKHHGKESTNLPDRIIGDLDSIKPEVKTHYESLGVPINKDPDQYSTDFTKCLDYLNANAAEIIANPRKTAKPPTDQHSSISSSSILEIVILGGLGGRVDQAFSQIHHLYSMTQTQRKLREAHQESVDDQSSKENKESSSSSGLNLNTASGGNLYLISEESITFVLQKGKNTIHTPATKRPGVELSQSQSQSQSDQDSIQAGGAVSESRKRKREQSVADSEYLFEENIGIIPLSAPASITTHGFEWDVEDWHTEIGGQLSTSNHIRADVVSVETSVPVLFTVELAERLKR